MEHHLLVIGAGHIVLRALGQCPGLLLRGIPLRNGHHRNGSQLFVLSQALQQRGPLFIRHGAVQQNQGNFARSAAQQLQGLPAALRLRNLIFCTQNLPELLPVLPAPLHQQNPLLPCHTFIPLSPFLRSRKSGEYSSSSDPFYHAHQKDSIDFRVFTTTEQAKSCRWNRPPDSFFVFLHSVVSSGFSAFRPRRASHWESTSPPSVRTAPTREAGVIRSFSTAAEHTRVITGDR